MKNVTEGKKLVVLSFFSGSGFLDLGFEEAGYEIALVNELSPSFLNAYKYSRDKMKYEKPRYGYFNIDINDFLESRKDELLNFINELRDENKLVGFIGGPPCPDFSIAGKNKGACGQNGKLSLTYINLIIETKPDFFLFENVKGLLKTAKHREHFEELKKMLQNSGYATTNRLCNSLSYGVPQDRERVIMVGFNNKLFNDNVSIGQDIVNFPWDRFRKYDADEIKAMPWSDTAEFGAVSQISEGLIPELTVQYWFDKNDVINHPNAKKHFKPRAGITKMKNVSEGDVSRKSYKRLHRYRYSPTAAYGNNEVHLHPCEERRISAAEAMAIQSMPKDFELPPDMTLSDMFKTIGNGVPFLLSNGIAKTIASFLEDNVCEK